MKYRQILGNHLRRDFISSCCSMINTREMWPFSRRIQDSVWQETSNGTIIILDITHDRMDEVLHEITKV